MSFTKVYPELSDEFYSLVEKTYLLGNEDSPIFLEELRNIEPELKLDQGRSFFDPKTNEWVIELSQGYGSVEIGRKPTKDEAAKLLWQERKKGSSTDYGF